MAPCTKNSAAAASATRAILRSRQAWKNSIAQISGAKPSGNATLLMPAAPPGSYSGMPASDISVTTIAPGPASRIRAHR
jgi:hypothetical protein